MSRVERNIQKKIKKRKRKSISKVLFILIMTANLFICIFTINQSAKSMLGEDTYNIEENIKDLQKFIEDKLGILSDNTKKLISQLNI